MFLYFVQFLSDSFICDLAQSHAVFLYCVRFISSSNRICGTAETAAGRPQTIDSTGDNKRAEIAPTVVLHGGGHPMKPTKNGCA